VSNFYYDYAEDSFLLLDSAIELLSYFHPRMVIEIGSGSGYVIIELLKKYPLIKGIATDLSFTACKETLNQAYKNNVDSRLQVVCTSFDLALKSFNSNDILYLFNPPYLPEDKSIDEKFSLNERLAYVGGVKGWETGFKMVEIALKKRNAPILIIYSSLSGPLEKYLEKCFSAGFHAKIIKAIRFEFEELVSILITPPNFFNN